MEMLLVGMLLVWTYTKFFCRSERYYHRPKFTDKLYRVHLVWAGFEITTSVVIGNYKSNCHTITSMVPNIRWISIYKGLERYYHRPKFNIGSYWKMNKQLLLKNLMEPKLYLAYHWMISYKIYFYFCWFQMD
jgi:hypothetical protein